MSGGFLFSGHGCALDALLNLVFFCSRGMRVAHPGRALLAGFLLGILPPSLQADNNWIDKRVTIQPIVMRSTDGSIAANPQLKIFEEETDKIWAQAGIDFRFLPVVYYDNSLFTNVSSSIFDPNSVHALALIEGHMQNTNPLVINLWFVITIDRSASASGFSLQSSMTYYGGLIEKNGVTIANSAFAYGGGAGMRDIFAYEVARNLGLNNDTLGATNDTRNLMKSSGPYPTSITNIFPDGLAYCHLTTAQVSRARDASFAVDLPENERYEYPPTHTLTAGKTGNGTIVPEGVVRIKHGDTTNFTVTASADHYIWSIKVNGTNVAAFGEGDTNYVYTLSNVTNDQSIAAAFETNAAAKHWTSGYSSPGTNTICTVFSYPTNRALLSLKLGWIPPLPAGWTVGSVWGAGSPQVTNGTGIVFTGSLTNNPIAFSYTALAPGGETGVRSVRASAEYQLDGMSKISAIPAMPDPLELKMLVTLPGLTAADKTYDGNTNAAIAGYGDLDGVVGGDDVSLVTAGGVAVFSTARAGAHRTVTVSGLALAGADADRYAILPQTTTADIMAKALTVAGAMAQNKVYDGNNVAQISGATLDGVVGTDDVVLTNHTTGTFAQVGVGTNIVVTTAPMTLTGLDVGNYTLIQPTGLTASIHQSPLNAPRLGTLIKVE